MKSFVYVICTCIFLMTNCSRETDENKLPANTEKEKTISKEPVKKIESTEDTHTDSESVNKNESLSNAKVEENSGEDSNLTLWDKYKKAKSNADAALAEGNIDKTVSELLKAADYAGKLNRPEIAAWQLNNIGFYLIQEFRRKTDYDNRMSELEEMKYGENKDKFLEETKNIIEQNMKLLENAQAQLNDADNLNNKLNDENQNERAEKIKSNLDFIRWIKEFLTN